MAIQNQQHLDRTFHALGDGTRRQILATLATHGRQTASDLRLPFKSAQPTISKHLKVLEQAGLVSRKIEGRTHFFQLEARRMDEALDWIALHKGFWENMLKSLDHFVTKPENDGATR